MGSFALLIRAVTARQAHLGPACAPYLMLVKPVFEDDEDQVVHRAALSLSYAAKALTHVRWHAYVSLL